MKKLKKIGMIPTSIEVKVIEGKQHKRVVSSRNDPMNYQEIDGLKEPYKISILINGIYGGSDGGKEVEDRLNFEILDYLSSKLL